MLPVLTQYHAALGKLSENYAASKDKVETLITTFQPEQDVKVLIERYRTGPFRPVAQVYESIAHDESDVVFGIDLRKWADAAYWSVSSPPGEKKEEVPPVFASLLGALVEPYPKLPNDMGTSWYFAVIKFQLLTVIFRKAQDVDLRGPAPCSSPPPGDAQRSTTRGRHPS